MNIPNLITVFRLLVIPIFVIAFYWPTHYSFYISALVFALAAFTDWLDGYLARRLNQVSSLGAFLDPVADKLMVAVALVLLVDAYSTPYLALPAAIIIGREIAISALREWMAELGQSKKVAVSYLGKLKTASQMLAIILLLSQNPKHPTILGSFGFVLLYLAVLLTLASMFMYLRAAWEQVKKASHP